MNAQVAFNDIVRDLTYSDMNTEPSDGDPSGSVEKTPTGLRHTSSPDNVNHEFDDLTSNPDNADPEIISWLNRLK